MHFGRSREEITTFGGLSRGQLMARVSSKGNKTTELRFVELLRSAGLKGWRRHQSLLGRPDFTWRKEKVVVFLDGCFWHGHDCGRNLTPKTNMQVWVEKISRNRDRDRRVRRSLRKLGWTVVSVWECELRRSPEQSVNRLRLALGYD